MDYINMIMDELELNSPNSNLQHQPQLSTHLSGWIPVLHNALAVIGALGLLEHLRDGCFWLPGYPKRRFEKDILGLYTFARTARIYYILHYLYTINDIYIHLYYVGFTIIYQDSAFLSD